MKIPWGPAARDFGWGRRAGILPAGSGGILPQVLERCANRTLTGGCKPQPPAGKMPALQRLPRNEFMNFGCPPPRLGFRIPPSSFCLLHFPSPGRDAGSGDPAYSLPAATKDAPPCGHFRENRTLRGFQTGSKETATVPVAPVGVPPTESPSFPSVAVFPPSVIRNWAVRNRPSGRASLCPNPQSEI